MDRRRDRFGEVRVQQLAPVLGHAELTAEQGLRRRRAEEDQNARLDRLQLGLEPGPAGGHLGPVRFLMNPSFASRLPLEVLDGVRRVGQGTVDLGDCERLVEELPCGPHERPTGTVLLVSGLLPDEHDLGRGCPLAEDGLGSELPEAAALAARRGLA